MRAVFRLAVLIALLAGVIAISRNDLNDETQKREPLYEEHRVPVRNPPVEPDRPDLFEEFRDDGDTESPQ